MIAITMAANTIIAPLSPAKSRGVLQVALAGSVPGSWGEKDRSKNRYKPEQGAIEPWSQN